MGGKKPPTRLKVESHALDAAFDAARSVKDRRCWRGDFEITVTEDMRCEKGHEM